MKIFDSADSAWKLGEKNLIGRICEKFGACVPPPPLGPADDCSVIKRNLFSENIYATCDAVILGRHFDANTPPELAGEKLVKRNASDVAAMGGAAKFALIAAVCSKNISACWLEKFCEGVGRAAAKYGIKIVGGDVASVPIDFFSAHLTLLGDASAPALLRTGVKQKDKIFVTGALGLSFESGHHLTFEPRLAEAKMLSEFALKNAEDSCGVSACIDLSDGVASDLKNLLKGNMCAVLAETSIPRTIYNGRCATLEEALCGGEDYELLFAWRGDSSEFESEFQKRFGRPIYKLGEFAGFDEICARTDFSKTLCGKLSADGDDNKSGGKNKFAGKIFIEYSDGSIKPFSQEGFSH